MIAQRHFRPKSMREDDDDRLQKNKGKNLVLRSFNSRGSNHTDPRKLKNKAVKQESSDERKLKELLNDKEIKMQKLDQDYEICKKACQEIEKQSLNQLQKGDMTMAMFFLDLSKRKRQEMQHIQNKLCFLRSEILSLRTQLEKLSQGKL